MKNFLTSFILTASFYLFGSLGSALYAQTVTEKKETAFYSDFYVMQVRPMKFKLSYNYPITDRVQVRILDVNKNIIFGEQTLVYKKYEKLFDLSVFADGQYTFELFDGDEKFIHKISIETKTTRIVTALNKQSVIVAGF